MSSDTSVDREFMLLTLNSKSAMPTTRSMAAQEMDLDGDDSDSSSGPSERRPRRDRAQVKLETASRQYDSRYLDADEWRVAVQGITTEYTIVSKIEEVDPPKESTQVFQFEIKNGDDTAIVRIGSKKSDYSRPYCITCEKPKKDEAPCRHVFHLMHHILEYDEDELEGDSWPLNMDGSALKEMGETPYKQIREMGLEELAQTTDGLTFEPRDTLPTATFEARKEELKDIIASFHPTKLVGDFEPTAWNGFALDDTMEDNGPSPSGWNFPAVMFTLALGDKQIFEKLQTTISHDVRDRSCFNKLGYRCRRILELLDAFLETGPGQENRIYDVKWAAGKLREEIELFTTHFKERKPLSIEVMRFAAGLLIELLETLEQRNKDAYTSTKWTHKPAAGEREKDRNLFESCTTMIGTRGRTIFLTPELWYLTGENAIAADQAASLKGVSERLKRVKTIDPRFGGELVRIVETLEKKYPALAAMTGDNAPRLSATATSSSAFGSRAAASSSSTAKRGHEPVEGLASSSGSKRGRTKK